MTRDTTIFVEPKSMQRGIRSLHNTDVNFEPHTGQDALDKESLVVIGQWQDYTGSGGTTKAQVMVQGTQNSLQGQVANLLEGERFSDLNTFGKRIATNRLRQKVVNLEFEPLNESK